jgi:hypothetical protein
LSPDSSRGCHPRRRDQRHPDAGRAADQIGAAARLVKPFGLEARVATERRVLV